MSTVSLVTGGNRGIGREVCRQLAERGHAVVLTDLAVVRESAQTRLTIRSAGSTPPSQIPGNDTR